MELNWVRHLFFMCGNSQSEALVNCELFDEIKNDEVEVLLKLKELSENSFVNKKYVDEEIKKLCS